MGGNCVVGYIQNFDLEGEHGIVVRGIGTVAYIYKNTINTKTSNSKLKEYYFYRIYSYWKWINQNIK